MSDVENIRYELGKEARAKGELLHDSASEQWRRGYSKTFGTNVMPKNFNKGDNMDDWACYCGHTNSAKRRHLKGGIELCWNCGVERAYSYVRDEDLDEPEN